MFLILKVSLGLIKPVGGIRGSMRHKRHLAVETTQICKIRTRDRKGIFSTYVPLRSLCWILHG